jgi:hypothetical protein
VTARVVTTRRAVTSRVTGSPWDDVASLNGARRIRMGKNKAKKGDGSSTRMVTTLAVTGGVFLLRKLLATAWTRVTGKVPPTDLTDPKVTLVEALAWSVATGIVVETARFAIVRSTMRKSLTDTGAESS